MVGSQLWSISYGVVLNYFYQHFDIIFLQASLIQVLQFLCLVKDFTPSIGHLNTEQILSTRAYAIVIISVIWTLVILASAMYFVLANLISFIAAYYLSTIRSFC